ncbi:MAG: glycosyltransferase [Saprospiraceae bacterium]|nr:glycosyltransferase [Saprospiraceae bacterium]
MKVLVIAPRFPFPLEKGDKLRLYQQLKHLSVDHEIHLFAISHHPVPIEDQQAIAPFCASIHVQVIPVWRLPWNMLLGLFQGIPFSVAYFTDHPAVTKLRQFYQQLHPDLTYGQLIRTGEYLKRLPGWKVMDLMDAFSVIMEQRSTRSPWWLRPFTILETSRLRRYERRVPHWVDQQTFISERDRTIIDPEQTWPATIIPNGIDTAYFTSRNHSSDPKPDLTFVGNLGYYPNRIAALFLAQEVMPIVWRARPETTLLLAGARPTRDVLALEQERLQVIPWLDDIRDGYQKGSLFVAPIHLGAGQQNKILEAMAMELPVVTTKHVNKAIGARPEKEVLLAESAEEFASQILVALSSNQLMSGLASSALTFVRSNYSWESSVNQLDEYVFQSHTNYSDDE